MRSLACVLSLVVLLAACGPPAPAPAPGADPATSKLDTFAAMRTTAVRERADGQGFEVTLLVAAGAPGCGTRPRLTNVTVENGLVHATSTMRSRAEGCLGQAERVAVLRVPPRGRDVVIDQEVWTPGPGRTYVRCGAMGCDPPEDRCDPAWTGVFAGAPELPPEQRLDVVACAPDGLVVDVDAVVTGCQSVDGSTPPASCERSGVHTRWFAVLDETRTWEVVASGTAAGCADVYAVDPSFPAGLCADLPARSG